MQEVHAIVSKWYMKGYKKQYRTFAGRLIQINGAYTVRKLMHFTLNASQTLNVTEVMESVYHSRCKPLEPSGVIIIFFLIGRSCLYGINQVRTDKGEVEQGEHCWH